MTDRPYYSVRVGAHVPDREREEKILRAAFLECYRGFTKRGYFQEYIGIDCVDGYQNGRRGNIEVYALRKLRQPGLLPINAWHIHSENEIFDIIEFLYDNVSEPLEESGYDHDWKDCGRHYTEFWPGAAREEFRDAVNEFLREHKDGYELSEDGEILTLPDQDLAPLLSASIPAAEPDSHHMRVNEAVKKFRRHKSSLSDRRNAVRDLVDVLELMRPRLKVVLDTPDEKDLFNIANNFSIRHANQQQKSKYDENIWLSWMFYFYLATIHAATRLVEKQHAKP